MATSSQYNQMIDAIIANVSGFITKVTLTLPNVPESDKAAVRKMIDLHKILVIDLLTTKDYIS